MGSSTGPAALAKDLAGIEQDPSAKERSMTCVHKSRAIGSHFERCLLCGSWRLHFYGLMRTNLTRRWWPAEVPMPLAPADDDSGTEYEDFKGWLEEDAA